MMEPTILRLQEKIAQRSDEILHQRVPGFEPQNADVRGIPRIEASKNPLNAVAPADARFVVLDREGRQAFTRDGNFSLRDGRLVIGKQQPVLGYAAGSPLLGELRIQRTDDVLGRVQHLHVERDGRVVYERNAIDPRTGKSRLERVFVGTIALARFPAGTEMQHFGVLERPPLGIQAHLGRPQKSDFGSLKVGQEELGAIDLNRALARLHDAYQQLDAIAAAQRVARDTAKTAMDLVK